MQDVFQLTLPFALTLGRPSCKAHLAPWAAQPSAGASCPLGAMAMGVMAMGTPAQPLSQQVALAPLCTLLLKAAVGQVGHTKIREFEGPSKMQPSKSGQGR